MIASFGIALSGLQAQSSRVLASAANLAGQQSRGALPDASGAVPAGQPEAYQPVASVQTASGVNGTRATLQAVNPAYIAQYEPDASYANAEGLVAAPNVDDAAQMVTMMTAHRSYQANLAVMRTTDEMLGSLLRLKA